MANPQIHNVNVADQRVLISPAALRDMIEVPGTIYEFVSASRTTIEQIIDRQDHRLMVVVGPCSIHDVDAALDYANRLKDLSARVADNLYLIMRVYFEKPRTTVGWKGLINDPNLDGSFDVEAGLRKARKLLIWLAELGLPAGTEMLDPITPQYLGELFCWSAIGARTTESQTHREMASGISMPVGFKNGTDGNVQVAINAIKSASIPHRFLGIDPEGYTSVVTTEGNPNTHLVLRGGDGVPNYEKPEVVAATERLEQANLQPSLMVDCSHANANKVAANQINVWNSILEQRKTDSSSITGAMIESFIEPDNEKIIGKRKYGLSITDPCIGWELTKEILLKESS